MSRQPRTDEDGRLVTAGQVLPGWACRWCNRRLGGIAMIQRGEIVWAVASCPRCDGWG